MVDSLTTSPSSLRQRPNVGDPNSTKPKTLSTSSPANDPKSNGKIFVRPDPCILIAAKDDDTQKQYVIAIVIGLALGTAFVVNILDALHNNILPRGWFEAWRDCTWAVPMGSLYLFAGIGHFVAEDTFAAMVPPFGTWGNLWRIPAPGATHLGLSYAEYHTFWSGVAEILLGGTLIAAGLGRGLPVAVPAFGLFVFTIAVTPANIYMATHDIQPPKLPPITYPNDHCVRGILQCILLACLWQLTFP